VDPFVEITSPENRAVATDPVAISGVVGVDDFRNLKLLVKQKGARNYWNGTAWQGNRIELELDAASIGAGGEWTYTLDQSVAPQGQGVPRDVVVRAFATYEDGTARGNRIRSDQVEIRF